MKSSLLESNIPENVQENIQRSKEKQAKYYNRNAKFLQEFNHGDTVRIAPGCNRLLAEVYFENLITQ
jgi:ribosomal protein L21E